MTDIPLISFTKHAEPAAGTVVILTDHGLGLSPVATALGVADLVRRAFAARDFKGKFASVLEILLPAGVAFDRLLIVGLGKAAEIKPADWPRLGGAVMGALRRGEQATMFTERPDGVAVTALEAAEIAEGAMLRTYVFDRYKSKKDDDAKKAAPSIEFVVAEPKEARKAWGYRLVVAEGALLARDLVNEPANVLGPEEFAAKAEALATLGVVIETLSEKQMKKLGMRALLGVAQGSVRPPRLVVMQWHGAKDGHSAKDGHGAKKGDGDGSKEKPLAFVGKGVVFDSGGISIKPAGGMEDMKGDMGGAAAVVGLMHALASRKAKLNVIGVIGIVENMPDGNAQRPGDIVEAASGVTIEIINTDAEGRLVLADALWYVQKTYEPKLIVDLATLTGAIIVALGHDHAGLFSNDDALAAALLSAGEATGEKVWRMPLGSAYDKQIESKFADIKNTGGRDGGSITAAQFIKRFINDGVAWAHLDIAGTAIGSPQTEVNRSWASGWGVRLLDRLVAGYERE